MGGAPAAPRSLSATPAKDEGFGFRVLGFFCFLGFRCLGLRVLGFFLGFRCVGFRALGFYGLWLQGLGNRVFDGFGT